jgi:glycine/D-amino acid oxidase-like deaminating enzyme
VQNCAGESIVAPIEHRVGGRVGYMAGYMEPALRSPRSISLIRNAVIGESTPYVYMTRRPYDRAGDTTTLTCIGGPEVALEAADAYRRDSPFPAAVMEELDGQILPMVDRDRRPGLEYDYAWHGLMGYTDSKVRLIGFEPRNPVLLYNLGCNGVGFLPSIYGGSRIAELLSGRPVERTIFDPR